LISGVIVPVDKMPAWTQNFAFISPLYYANEIIHHLLVEGLFVDTLDKFFQLVLFGVVVLLLAVLTLQERD